MSGGSPIGKIAHAKTMVIDGAITLQGSYNWNPARLGRAR